MNYNEEELADLLKRNPDVNVATGVSGINRTDSHMATGANLPKKPSKYRNQRTPYNGRVYDTKGEAEKAAELDLKVKAGEIDFWLYHVRFPLPGDCYYESDFVTFKMKTANDFSHEKLWRIEVIEKKMYRKSGKNQKEGFWFTDSARLKMNLFKETYPNIKLTIEK